MSTTTRPPKTRSPDNRRAELVAAAATGTGIGLVTFMAIWTIGARVVARFWGPPAGAIVAMTLACLAGLAIGAISSVRLARHHAR